MAKTCQALVVADDPVITQSIEHVLRSKACAVTTVSNGEEALWELGKAAYDVVFTDIPLRGMSGLELADEIRSRWTGLPLVVFDHAGSNSLGENASAEQAVEFLRKPVSSERLTKIVDRLLAAANSDRASVRQVPAAENKSISAAARLKSIVLFFLAPLFAVGYMLTFPVVWLGLLIWSEVNAKDRIRADDEQTQHSAATRRPGIPKTIALMLVALSVGIGFAVIAPILGVGLLFSFALQAWVRLGTRQAESSG